MRFYGFGRFIFQRLQLSFLDIPGSLSGVFIPFIPISKWNRIDQNEEEYCDRF